MPCNGICPPNIPNGKKTTTHNRCQCGGSCDVLLLSTTHNVVKAISPNSIPAGVCKGANLSDFRGSQHTEWPCTMNDSAQLQRPLKRVTEKQKTHRQKQMLKRLIVERGSTMSLVVVWCVAHTIHKKEKKGGNSSGNRCSMAVLPVVSP